MGTIPFPTPIAPEDLQFTPIDPNFRNWVNDQLSSMDAMESANAQDIAMAVDVANMLGPHADQMAMDLESSVGDADALEDHSIDGDLETLPGVMDAIGSQINAQTPPDTPPATTQPPASTGSVAPPVWVQPAPGAPFVPAW